MSCGTSVARRAHVRVYPLIALFTAAVVVAACDSKTPTAPSPSSPTSTSTAASDYVLIIRALDADTKAALSGLDVAILDGPRAGSSSSSPSDQLPLSLPAGHVTLRVSAAGHEPKQLAVDVIGAALLEVPVRRSPAPAPPPPAVLTVTGVVRDAITGNGISNAQVEVTSGADAGRSTTTDARGSFHLDNIKDGTRGMRASAANYVTQIVGGTDARTIDFTLTPEPRVFSGFVRDGQGRPVVGALV